MSCTPPNNASTIFQVVQGQGQANISQYNPCYQGTVSYQNVLFSTQNLYSLNIQPTFQSQTIAIPAVFKSSTPILNFIVSTAPITSGSFIGSRQDTVYNPPNPMLRVTLTGSVPNQYTGLNNQTNTFVSLSNGNDYGGPQVVMNLQSPLSLNNNYVFYVNLQMINESNNLNVSVFADENYLVNEDFGTIGTKGGTVTGSIPLPPSNSYYYYIAANDMNSYAITLGQNVYTQSIPPCPCYSPPNNYNFAVQQIASNLPPLPSNSNWNFASHRFRGQFPSTFQASYGFNFILTSKSFSNNSSSNASYLQFTNCPPFSTDINPNTSGLLRFMIGIQGNAGCDSSNGNSNIPTQSPGTLLVSINNGSESNSIQQAFSIPADTDTSTVGYTFDVILLESLSLSSVNNKKTFYGVVKLSPYSSNNPTLSPNPPQQSTYIIPSNVYVSPIIEFQPVGWDQTSNVYLNYVMPVGRGSMQCYYGVGPLNLEYMAPSTSSLQTYSGCGNMICLNSSQTIPSKGLNSFSLYPAPTFVTQQFFQNPFLIIKGNIQDPKNTDSIITFSTIQQQQWTENISSSSSSSSSQYNYFPCSKIYISTTNFVGYSPDGTDENLQTVQTTTILEQDFSYLKGNTPFTIFVDFQDSVIFFFLGEIVDINSGAETVPLILSLPAGTLSSIFNQNYLNVYTNSNVTSLEFDNSKSKTLYPILSPGYSAFLAQRQCPPGITNTNYCVSNYNPSTGKLLNPSVSVDGTIGIYMPVQAAVNSANLQGKNAKQVLREVGVDTTNNFIGPNLCPNNMDICVPEFVQNESVSLNNANILSPCPSVQFFSDLSGKQDDCALACLENYSVNQNKLVTDLSSNLKCSSSANGLTCEQYLLQYYDYLCSSSTGPCSGALSTCLNILSSDPTQTLTNNAPTPAYCSLYGTGPQECTSGYINKNCYSYAGQGITGTGTYLPYFTESLVTNTFSGLPCASNLVNNYEVTSPYQCPSDSNGQPSPWGYVYSNLYTCRSSSSNKCTDLNMVENQYGMCVVPPPTFSVVPSASAFQLCNSACNGPSGNSSSFLSPGWNVSSCTGSFDLSSCVANVSWSTKNTSDAFSTVYPQVCSYNSGTLGIQMSVSQSPNIYPQLSIQSSSSFLTGSPVQTNVYQVIGEGDNANIPLCGDNDNDNLNLTNGELDPNNANSWNMANLFDSSFYKQNLTSNDSTFIPFTSLYGFSTRNTNYASYLPNLFS